MNRPAGLTPSCADDGGYLVYGPGRAVTITRTYGPRGGRNGWQAHVMVYNGRALPTDQRAPLAAARLLSVVADAALTFVRSTS